MSVTIDDMVAGAKRLANMQVSEFLSDSEWEDFVHNGYRALYAEVVTLDPQFRISTSSPVTLSPTVNTITLASAFLQLLAVVRDPGTTFERVLNPRGIRPTGDDLTYRIEGGAITIEPKGSAAGTYAYRYVPQVVDLAGGSAIDVELEQFRKYVELSAAIDCLASDEADITALSALLGAEVNRVRGWASRRRKTDHEVVEDVRGRRGRTGPWGIY